MQSRNEENKPEVQPVQPASPAQPVQPAHQGLIEQHAQVLNQNRQLNIHVQALDSNLQDQVKLNVMTKAQLVTANEQVALLTNQLSMANANIKDLEAKLSQSNQSQKGK